MLNYIKNFSFPLIFHIISHIYYTVLSNWSHKFTAKEINLKPAEFLKWNNPPSIFGTFHYNI